MHCPITPQVERLVELAIEEDLGRGDVTTDCLLLEETAAEGRILAREELVVCGLELTEYVFARIGPELDLSILVTDGEEVSDGAELILVNGPAAAMLMVERTALNFLQRLSGVATTTRRYVKIVSATGAKARVVDTRKTLPGWRILDKWAVKCGGGGNHRVDLGSGVLIKDNHIAACGSVWEAIKRAQRLAPHTLRIEVEVTNLAQLDEALDAGADIIMLDNMNEELLSQAVQRADGRALLEASGGINRDTVAAVALTGVDLVSVGRLTHSARSVDISMEIIEK
jgi:nicotinate-nucleotide pyrophosphorylase (carboxylating)